ncbi:MAG TPA: LLM class flavin-dependent oxidoreductase [Candidatus Limnocylindrales bacterium]|jgi:alkanesulfonate monooxygenase SsuD/methylene tetrahydromethanopterin reductase-like flavin-dependent oxidoreductase (luciferase family)
MTDAARVSLGLNLPYVEGSMDGATPRWADIRAMAEEAERIGFDAVWVSDHVGFGDPDADWNGAWECWTLLTALGVATSRVRLGTYVAAIPYRSPALLAKMAETLDEISGGRVILGVGAGWNEPEFTAYGFPWERRFDRFEDGLRIIASMLRTGRADHDGRVASVRGALVRPRGPRPEGLPLMIGAAAPRMLRLTAELADEWNAGMRTPAGFMPMANALDAALAAAGRDAGSIRRSAEAMVEPAGTPVDDGDPDTFGSWERPFAGSPEVIAAGLRRYATLGCDHVQVQLRPNTVDSVRRFAPVIDLLRSG